MCNCFYDHRVAYGAGMVRARRTGGYAVGRARREAILDTAASRFSEAGYHRTPMAGIARDVGLTERGLLHHFPTKGHLLIAVAERRFDLLLEWVAEVPESADGLRPLRALLGMTSHFLAQTGFIELFVLVAAETAAPDSPAGVLYAERYGRAVREFTRDFRPGVAAGVLRPDIDYAAVARRCVAVCDGLQLQWVLSRGSLDLLGELRAFLEELSQQILVSGDRADLSDVPVGPGDDAPRGPAAHKGNPRAPDRLVP
jgi:AcrR family transcriptional regulator